MATKQDLLDLLPSNGMGSITAEDMRTVTEGLWDKTVIDGSVDGNIPVFTTDVELDTGVLIDSGESLADIVQMTTVTSGNTASRPATPLAGQMYFDTDLAVAGQPIWYTGADWVDSSGTIV